MKNIEIKARVDDPAAVRAIALELAPRGPQQDIVQEDTYFHVPAGRLKLRVEQGPDADSRLVFYQRPDTPGPKASDYDMASVSDPDATKKLLDAALGVAVVVRKRREIFLYKNVRIHLDEVQGLGSFMEFEAVMGPDTPEDMGEPLVRKLLKRFNIAEPDLIAGSYSDMLMNDNTEPPHGS